MTRPRWMDEEEAGPVVRPFALTQGRARSSVANLDLITMVTSVGAPLPGDGSVGPEQRRILEITRSGAPVADIASDIDLPLGVVRVLIGDLHDQGLIVVRPPVQVAPQPSERILKEVINGLRAL